MLKVTLIGHLGRDPEMRYMPSGDPVTQVSVACRTGKDKEGTALTTWVNLSFFNKLAEVANQYLKKGSQVYVEGRLKVRTYQNKDGSTGISTDVAVDRLEMLSGKPQEGHAQGQAQAGAAPTAAGGTEPEELPF